MQGLTQRQVELTSRRPYLSLRRRQRADRRLAPARSSDTSGQSIPATYTRSSGRPATARNATTRRELSGRESCRPFKLSSNPPSRSSWMVRRYVTDRAFVSTGLAVAVNCTWATYACLPGFFDRTSSVCPFLSQTILSKHAPSGGGLCFRSLALC